MVVITVKIRLKINTIENINNDFFILIIISKIIEKIIIEIIYSKGVANLYKIYDVIKLLIIIIFKILFIAQLKRFLFLIVSGKSEYDSTSIMCVLFLYNFIYKKKQTYSIKYNIIYELNAGCIEFI